MAASRMTWKMDLFHSMRTQITDEAFRKTEILFLKMIQPPSPTEKTVVRKLYPILFITQGRRCVLKLTLTFVKCIRSVLSYCY